MGCSDDGDDDRGDDSGGDVDGDCDGVMAMVMGGFDSGNGPLFLQMLLAVPVRWRRYGACGVDGNDDHRDDFGVHVDDGGDEMAVMVMGGGDGSGG